MAVVYMKTVKDKILAKIKRAPKGTLFSLGDFHNMGSYRATKNAVLELIKEEKLIKVFNGIYQKPNYSEFLKTNISASPMEIAEKYAQKHQWEIAPAGVMALNLLGLDTQVPNTYNYISDGPSREIILQNGKRVQFRHVQEKDTKMNRVSSLVIEALKHIGKDNITDTDLTKIRSKIDEKQMKQLVMDSAIARVWIREIIKRMDELHV